MKILAAGVIFSLISIAQSVTINFRNYTAQAQAAAAVSGHSGGTSAAALAERTKLQQQQIQQLQAVAAAQQKQQQQAAQLQQQQQASSVQVPGSGESQSQPQLQNVAPSPSPESEPTAEIQVNQKPNANTRWCEIHVYKKSRVTWLEAYRTCRSIGNGTELATIKSEEDYKLISSRAREAGSPASVIYWTSGTDLIDEGEFVWMTDGTSVTRTFWALGQPDNHWESEHCIALKRLPHESQYQMTDENCLMAGAFICTQPCVFWT